MGRQVRRITSKLLLVTFAHFVILHCPKKKSLEGLGEQSKPYANEKIYLSLTTLQEFRAAFFAVGLLAVDQC